MSFSRRWPLILLLLLLGCELIFAAGSKKEERAYAAAVGAFQEGMWSRAETEFAQFVDKYPESSHVAEAKLLWAQAEFKGGKYAQAIALLQAGRAAAADLADEYVYWIGAAQLQSRDFAAAAGTFISLTQNYPKSKLRLKAVVDAAAAFTELQQWSQVAGLLQESNGVFQRAMQRDTGSELVVRGQLLLAQALFAQGDFTGAATLLQSLDSLPLAPELDWQRVYLLCQARLAAGDTNAALSATTNLLRLGRLEKDDTLRAESMALRGDVLEKMGRPVDAQAAYRENLATNAPAFRQREAALKIAELAIGQNQFSNAIPVLEGFLIRFPNSPAADTVVLTLGELHLKNYVAQPAATNQLSAARERFDQFIGTFTNSPLLGLAFLDRGWCGWLAENFPQSLPDFKAAVEKLPPSPELLVARFKLADVLFRQEDFAGALENYRAVLAALPGMPELEQQLGERALYQTLRACLKLKDAAGAGDAFAEIFKKYPEGTMVQGSSLLYGESLAEPAAARALFEKLAAQLPGSALQPQIGLAVARTYEREQNWPAAVTNYESWLKIFPTNALQPQVVYALAQADFQAGSETNALTVFTNFVAQFHTNDLAPLAQWWVADYFFRQADYVNAERNYKFVFESWPASNLAYPARMMAGRAAVARLDYSGAIRDYFLKLEQETNCPIELRLQATFAHGSALMLSSDSTDTNQPLANFQLATNRFAQIIQMSPDSELGALAWGAIGECALQLSAFDDAMNAFTQVFNSPAAGISARSQAQIGFGIALEKKAALANAEDRDALLKQARDNYLDVFDTVFGKNLRTDELADPFWVKKAGLQALPLVESFGTDSPDRFIDKLEELLPQLRDMLEAKRAILAAGKK